MRDETEFEMLLSSVLHEVANPEPVEGVEQRMMRSFGMVEQPEMMRPAAGVLTFGGGIKEEGILASLWSNVRELVFPRRLPPLILESRPVPMIDRLDVDGGYSSAAYAFALHAMVIFLIGFVVRAQVREADRVHDSVTPLIDSAALRVAAKAAEQMGGGGGQRGEIPVSKGHLPNLGVPNSPIVSRSMGSGKGTGMGPGDGDGIGPGSGGNKGGGVRHVGGTVSAPEVLHAVDPEFSEEARKAKVSGDVQVYLWVDEHGNPTHVRVIRGMGMGLDERAVEAVKQYKFKPAMENGRPVTVEMYIDVTFQIF
jgi:protein TonB